MLSLLFCLVVLVLLYVFATGTSATRLALVGKSAHRYAWSDRKLMFLPLSIGNSIANTFHRGHRKSSRTLRENAHIVLSLFTVIQRTLLQAYPQRLSSHVRSFTLNLLSLRLRLRTASSSVPVQTASPALFDSDRRASQHTNGEMHGIYAGRKTTTAALVQSRCPRTR